MSSPLVHCEQQIVIAATPDRIFAVLADPTRLRDYLSPSPEVRATPGIANVGTQFVVIGVVAGRTGEVTYQVTECDVPRRFCTTFRGPLGSGLATTTLEQVDGGTRVTHLLEQTPNAGLARFIPATVANDFARRSQQRMLLGLKQLVERDEVTASSG